MRLSKVAKYLKYFAVENNEINLMLNKELMMIKNNVTKGFYSLIITAKNSAIVETNIVGTIAFQNTSSPFGGNVDVDVASMSFRGNIPTSLITIAYKLNDSFNVVDISPNGKSVWNGKSYIYNTSLFDFSSYPKHGSIFIGYTLEEPPFEIPQTEDFPNN